MIDLAKNFLERAQATVPNLDVERIVKAIDFADHAHHGQQRASGEAYIGHPIAVATIMLDLKVDEDTLVASLLHDVVEDCEEDADECRQKLQKIFGSNVAQLIEGVTKFEKLSLSGEERQAASIRKMLLAMHDDVRILLIKLADRLHNMQTLEFLRPDKQKRIAQETLEIYAPLAARIGVYALKVALEDLAFFYLYPAEYTEIGIQLSQQQAARQQVIDNAQALIDKVIKQHKMNVKVSGRVKNAYSIYRKMQKKHTKNVGDVYDIFALRVIVPNVEDCYRLLGLLHEHFTPLNDRFKDYIAVPKPNGYRSLHTTVIGLSPNREKSLPVEIQIRTTEMNDQAEYGIAAHWNYKESKGSHVSVQWAEDVSVKPDGKTEAQFIHDIAQQELCDRIYALTPAGDVIDLPQRATALDFAFFVHTDLGLRAKTIRVNGKAVPLGYKLGNGDIVEIITHKSVQATVNWHSIVTTSRASNKLRSYLNQKDKGVLLREGRDQVNKHLRRLGLAELDQDCSSLRCYNHKNLTKEERQELVLRVGNGSLSAAALVRNITEQMTPSVSQKSIKKHVVKDAQDLPPIIIGGEKNFPIKMAKCCSDLTVGDTLVGYVTRGNSITIHRRSCSTLKHLDKKRFLDAWFEGHQLHRVTIETTRLMTDRRGLLHEITGIFLEEQINVTNVYFKDQSDHEGKMGFEIEFSDWEQLTNAMERIEEIPEIEKVQKV